MNRIPKHSLLNAGLTLLESMLVLILVSTIIVMSMRYYNNAVTRSHMTGIVSALQSASGDIERYANNGADLSKFTTENLTNKFSPLGPVTVAGFDASTQMIKIAFAAPPTSEVCSQIVNMAPSLGLQKWFMDWSGNCGEYEYQYVQ